MSRCSLLSEWYCFFKSAKSMYCRSRQHKLKRWLQAITLSPSTGNVLTLDVTKGNRPLTTAVPSQLSRRTQTTHVIVNFDRFDNHTKLSEASLKNWRRKSICIANILDVIMTKMRTESMQLKAQSHDRTWCSICDATAAWAMSATDIYGSIVIVNHLLYRGSPHALTTAKTTSILSADVITQSRWSALTAWTFRSVAVADPIASAANRAHQLQLVTRADDVDVTFKHINYCDEDDSVTV